MNNLLLTTTSSILQKKRPVPCFLAACLLTCMLLLGFTPVSQAHTHMVLADTDSTSIQQAEHDVAEMKEHIDLTEQQEENIFNIFLAKHQFVVHLGNSGKRWEITMKGHIRRLRELLGEKSYLNLANKGLVKKWFGLDQ